MSDQKQENKEVFAIHGKTDDGGTHLVGIGNLRVIITNENESWFAQGLEIDYAAQGVSLEDVKKRFGQGLHATIKENLKLFGTIENLLHAAPHDVWVELWKCGKEFKRYTQIAVHEIPTEAQLPFQKIEYIGVAA